jgi:hypothetical protein
MAIDEEQEQGNYLQKFEQTTGISKQDIQRGVELSEKIVDLQVEHVKAVRDIEVTREASKVEIKKIDERHKTIRGYLGEKLAQSRARMNEEFKVIDQGLAEHNDMLVVKGLNSLDKLSEENPVDELAEIEKLL